MNLDYLNKKQTSGNEQTVCYILILKIHKIIRTLTAF